MYDAGTVYGVTGSSVNPVEAVIENQDVWSKYVGGVVDACSMEDGVVVGNSYNELVDST